MSSKPTQAGLAESQRAPAVAANQIPGRSVRAKLIGLVLLTTALALLVSSIAILAYDLTVYRKSWTAGLQTQAGILALSTAPALAFDDRSVAERNLAALQARPDVIAAAIYTPSGQRYAHYARANEQELDLKQTALDPGAYVAGERVDIIHEVVQNDELLGTIHLRARYDLWAQIRAYLGILIFAGLLSIGAALVLTTRLQRAITLPLEGIADVAHRVVRQRDYTLRATQTTDDEIGIVVDAFNNMLDEVQSRARALEESNASLRQSEKRYRAIGESINYGVWVCDAQGRNVYASESFLKLTGMTQTQCSQLGWAQMLHPEDVEATITAWEECVRSGQPWYRELRFLGVDGQYHPMLSQGVAIRGDDGSISGWAGINLDISRLKQTEEALREADRRKDEFLATLAHELRNPLAPVRHATKILDLPAANETQRRWARDVIARQVQHMALLLDDLLDVSRITRGRLELKRDYVELDKLVSTAVETAAPLIEAKNHVFKTQLPDEPVGLNVDPLRMAQALSNLLTNAAKYTDTGGHIEVSARLVEGGVTITVTDTGIGLTDAMLLRIFEMFSQVESAKERSQGGLGIGLALVKGLVTLHGGKVEAVSGGLGQGSSFTIRLPESCLVRQAIRLPGSEQSQESFAGDAATKILVADDNHDAADSLSMLLQISGYQVVLAHSGREAIATAEQERPDALVLDIGMPDMSGYEVARHLRKTGWGRDVLLIAVTGWGQLEDKQQARDAGFDHHLTKPVAGQQLEKILQRLRRPTMRSVDPVS
jgi:PAS domain S-box-containing protein